MRSGFTIAQVVHNYGDVHKSITELAIERNASITTEEFRALDNCLDNAIAEAVTAYAQRHELEVAAEAAHHANRHLEIQNDQRSRLARECQPLERSWRMSEELEETSNPRCWKKAGWIARVVKNENDDGWAVEMTRIGESEPSLVSPWTMGRDKVNPKPLDHAGFATLVKGATEVMARHAQAARARLHRSIYCQSETGARLRASFDIQEDEDDPHAILLVTDEQTGETLRSGRASTGFKLNEKAVQQFLRTGDA